MKSYCDQVLLFTTSNMRARYRGTFAGFIWVVLSPIILFTAQSLVFKYILKIEVHNYALFLVGGLLPWLFITQTLDMCIPILQGAGELLKSYRIHPSTLIVSQVLDNFFNFSFAFAILLIPILIYSSAGGWEVFLLPIAVVNLVVGVGYVVWGLGILQVFYRDTKFVVQFVTSVMFFATPIFYPVSRIPEGLKWMVEINPYYRFIEPLRICIYGFSVGGFFISFGKSIICTAMIIVLARRLWKRRKNEFYLLV
ncbi:MAG: ABC transporter permease [Bacteriovoracaceae bacterium]|nr:ABC transporter permease [Bacteriovoracaceae bacterium]